MFYTCIILLLTIGGKHIKQELKEDIIFTISRSAIVDISSLTCFELLNNEAMVKQINVFCRLKKYVERNIRE